MRRRARRAGELDGRDNGLMVEGVRYPMTVVTPPPTPQKNNCFSFFWLSRDMTVPSQPAFVASPISGVIDTLISWVLPFAEKIPITKIEILAKR